MITNQSSAERKLKYRVELVEKSDAPDGMTGDNWHRYVIGTGASRIEGRKPGTMKAVKEYAESVATNLNDRAGGRGYSAYTSRKTK